MNAGKLAMSVPISRLSIRESEELRIAATETLAVLRLALASALDHDTSANYGVDLADAAALADVTAALHRFLERDSRANEDTDAGRAGVRAYLALQEQFRR